MTSKCPQCGTVARSLSPSDEKQGNVNENSQVGVDQESIRKAEDLEWLKEKNEMLTLHYMVENSPWKDEDMPGIEPRLDHYPPIFDFGVAFTMPKILDFTVKKGIIEKLPASDDTVRRLRIDIQNYFNEKFGFRFTLEYGMPQIVSKERLFSFSVWTNYKCCLSESKKSHVVEVMKSEFEVEELTWFISYMNKGLAQVPLHGARFVAHSLREHSLARLCIVEDQFLAFLAVGRQVKR
ncbi:hypothetical protein E1B28_003101 [Marasmius oreades]|uniref:Uncharacterized protein n=1 Tax=Marasmius oreades TaxID=181124 RepID=A0A9P7RMC0_9AGAR|nr:uncharacterized protein E1B28_003101 [Marasmius oreades]KAG7085543.1 hypothetical protein E1B28_003101 [Marasmius oreades]